MGALPCPAHIEHHQGLSSFGTRRVLRQSVACGAHRSRRRSLWAGASPGAPKYDEGALSCSFQLGSASLHVSEVGLFSCHSVWVARETWEIGALGVRGSRMVQKQASWHLRRPATINAGSRFATRDTKGPSNRRMYRAPENSRAHGGAGPAGCAGDQPAAKCHQSLCRGLAFGALTDWSSWSRERNWCREPLVVGRGAHADAAAGHRGRCSAAPLADLALGVGGGPGRRLG